MSEKNFLNAADVSEYMNISIPMAYKIIRKLNDELKENTWLGSKEDKDYLMNSDTKDMWKEALEKLGSKYEAWSRFPRVPTFN